MESSHLLPEWTQEAYLIDFCSMVLLNNRCFLLLGNGTVNMLLSHKTSEPVLVINKNKQQ
jgi:hypothetical protein